MQAGKILALRGMGGYQLLADATSSEVVTRLRLRKQRPAKPFAVLCRNLAENSASRQIEPRRNRLHFVSENPIVVVRQRQPSRLCQEINPGLRDLGLMLPTTGLHDLFVGRNSASVDLHQRQP